MLGNSRTVLDIGSGNGGLMSVVNFDHKYTVDGIEIFDPYIKLAKKTGVYRRIIRLDISKLNPENKSYDCVLCSQLIEHLDKNESLKLIDKMGKIARRLVVIGTPNGWIKQEIWENNIHQKHKSGWSKDDLLKLNYRVSGTGLKCIYGDDGILKSFPNLNLFFRNLLYLVSFFANPLIYWKPEYAAQLVACKRVDSV
jgi:SAM-dependent methyltransferase